MIGNRYSRWLVPFALVITCAAAVTASTSASAARATNPWSVVTAPASTSGQALAAVSADSTTDAWAVGGNQDGQDQLIDHWNGARWSVSQSVSGNHDGGYNDVAALSPSNVYAVGTTPTDGALLEHWNGAAWSKVTFTGRFSNGYLSGISALSPTSIYVVDTFSDIYHYNGTSWSLIYKAPETLYGQQEDTKIIALSSTDVWVSTMQTDISQENFYAYAIHWNGSKATSYKLPKDVLAAPQGISASDPDHVWIAGTYFGGQSTLNPYAVMWNGSKWVLRLPPGHTTDSELAGVVAFSPTNVWTLGDRQTYTFNLEDEWTGGGKWAEWGGPNPGSGRNALLGVTRIPGTNQMWAVGFQSTHSSPGHDTPLILRCCSP